MKIEHLTATLHEMEVILPDIDRLLERRQFVFCQVETDEGISGFGLTGHFAPWSIIAALEHHILPTVKGMDPYDIEAIHARIGKRVNPRGYTGVVSNALSALDIALWDIRGKKEGRTVAQLMGGYRDEVPAYITFGYAAFDRDQLVHYANMFTSQGCKALKMIVGQSRQGWREDVHRVRVVRDAIGPDVDLMVDANANMNPDEARWLAHALRDFDLKWFEEPIHHNDARVLADLRAHASMPIAAGQMEGHRWRVRELIVNHAVDVIQPNCCFCGGFTEVLKIAHTAQTFNLPLSSGGGWPAFNIHPMAGLMNGGSIEYHYGTWEANKRFFKGAPDPDLATNSVKLSSLPGLGFQPDYDQLRDSRQTDPSSYRQGGMHMVPGA